MSNTWDYDDLAASGTRRQLLVRGGALALSTSAAGVLLNACGGEASTGGGTPVAVSKVPTAPYDPNVAVGAAPDLPRRIALSLPTGGELFTNFSNAIDAAAERYDLEYISAQANNDSAKQVEQTQSFLARGIGGLLIVDVAAPALANLQQQAIDQGIATITGPFPPSTSQVEWDEYERGKAQAETAVRWMKENVDGKSEIVNLVVENSPHVRERYKAIAEVLSSEGLEPVAQQSGGLDPESGREIAETILQQHPNANIWIGSDSVLAGVMSVLEASGKDGPNVGLFGMDGDAQALDAIAAGSIYRSTQAISLSVTGYAWAKYASEWLEGKSIPLALLGKNVTVDSPEAVDELKQIDEDPGAALAENERSFKYFEPLGNTSYEDNKYLTTTIAS